MLASAASAPIFRTCCIFHVALKIAAGRRSRDSDDARRRRSFIRRRMTYSLSANAALIPVPPPPSSLSRAVISAYFFLFEMPYVSKKRINNSLFAPVCRLCIRERRERNRGVRFRSPPMKSDGCGYALKFTRHAGGGFSFWQMASNEVPAVLLDSVHRPLSVLRRARCRMPTAAFSLSLVHQLHRRHSIIQPGP